jgi:hypothetical protein
MKKWCPRCERERSAKHFHKNKRGKHGLHTYCIECHAKYNRAKYDPAKQQGYRLKCEYGITLQQYDAMLAAQDGTCAICRSDDPVTPSKRFCIDHDHVTGAIRGLLCSHCNRALGMLKDDPEALRRAADYLEATQEEA